MDKLVGRQQLSWFCENESVYILLSPKIRQMDKTQLPEHIYESIFD